MLFPLLLAAASLFTVIFEGLLEGLVHKSLQVFSILSRPDYHTNAGVNHRG